MKKWISLTLVITFVLSLFLPSAEAAGISNHGILSKKIQRVTQKNEEAVKEFPDAKADIITIPWLSQAFQQKEETLIAEVNKGYSLQQLFQALQQSKDNGQSLDTVLNAIAPEPREKDLDIHTSIRNVEKQLVSTSEKLSTSKQAKSALPERAASVRIDADSKVVEGESTVAVEVYQAKSSPLKQAMASSANSAPELPNLASTYDEAAANKMTFHTDNAPYSVSNGSEHISTVDGSLTLNYTDLTLPGRNGLSFSLNRTYNSSAATYFDNDVKWKQYQRKWFYPVVQLYVDKVDPSTGFRSSSGLPPALIYMDPYYFQYDNIIWGVTPPAYFAYEYADETNALASVQNEVAQYHNNLPYYAPWQGGISGYGKAIWYMNYPTGQVIELPYLHDNLTAGYKNIPSPAANDTRFPLGKGWSWDISYIRFKDSKRFISIAGSGTYEISGSNQLIGYPWKDLSFAPDPATKNVNGKTSSYVLRSTNGVSQYFSSDGKLIQISDNYDNAIQFYYANVSPYGEVLVKVTDALDNAIQIAYSTTEVTLTLNDQTVTYHKGPWADKEFLGSVTDAQGRTTSYGYSGAETKYNLLGSGYEDGSNYNLLLTQVVHPTQAQTTYTYGSYRKSIGSTASEDTWFVQSREDLIDYSDGTQVKSNHNDFTYGNPGNYGVDTTFTNTVSDGLVTTSYTFNKDFIDANTPDVYYNTTITQQSGTQIVTTTNTFDDPAKMRPVPLATSKSVTVQGTTGQALTSSVTYDDYGNVLTSIDPLGVTTTFTYDAQHLLASSAAPVSSSLTKYTAYTRNAQGSITGMTVRENNASGAIKQNVAYDLDAYGNIVGINITDDARTVHITNEYGAAYNFGFPTKQIAQVTDAEGQISTIASNMEYNKVTGQLTTLIDGRGNALSNTYDKLGRVTKQRMQDNSETNIVYDDVLNKITTTDALGKITEAIFNPFGWKTAETLGLGYATYGYDSYGRKTWDQDAKGHQTQYAYDAWGRLTSTTHADQSASSVQYDDVAQTMTTTDEENNTIREVHDLLGRVIRKEEIKPNETIVLSSYEYDWQGNLTKTTDAANHSTVYEYDILNRLVSATDAEGKVTRYTYSTANNLIEIQYPDGQKTQKHYDELGRLISSTNPLGQQEKMFYDANSNLIRSVDAKNQTTTYTYNNRNFLMNSSTPMESISYTYDVMGKRLSMTDGTGTTQYSYYNSARLRDILYPDGTMLDLEYDVQDVSIKYVAFDYRLEFEYDNRNRLTSTLIQGTDHVEGDQWFVYNAGLAQRQYRKNSQISQVSYHGGLWTQTNTYDGFNLSSISYAKAGQSLSYSYTYDHNRNIIGKNENGESSSFTYDPLQRIQTSSQFNETYAYDNRGNRQVLTSSSMPELRGATYTYDDRNRLTSATTASGETVTYRYNGDGLLFERTENGVTSRYYYDEQGNLFREGTVNASGQFQLRASYIYDGGTLAARFDAATQTMQYYVRNGHGDITELTDELGQTLNAYSYDIWGNPLTIQETVPQPFRYSGEFWDDTTGLQYLRARWYDPSMGRFINEDTYEGQLSNPLSLNLYTYVDNNPLTRVDPTGNSYERIEVQTFINIARLEGASSQAWWDVRSTMGIEARKNILNSLTDNNQFKYLFNMATLNHYDPNENTLENANWAQEELIKMYDSITQNEEAADSAMGFSGTIKFVGKAASLIKNEIGLVKAAEKMGKNQMVQKEADELVAKFLSGNTNPGLGTKNLFKDIYYLRGDEGARVFYRMANGEMQILAKSSKANEDKVIKILTDIYGR
ncbi:RHS repeat-associated core domain-containing protein [Paenibacillus whitsoniae]|uniref:RHS repeat protein n=1 Tax=Paenibacillus whitsoniae TaxID=2496558 RepID=A0A3S0CCC6_9BACL|nr:RHS repeat-associated core domain-containing protein [Paenibacillus whitsoniae]RTE10629.1 RHS repeat protein [Paenibacillus whitsoniae]